jgi:hypothetical protein
MDLYIHSPIRLHGVVLNEAQGQLCLLPLYVAACNSEDAER